MVGIGVGLSPFSVTMLGGAQPPFDPSVFCADPSNLLGAWYADEGITLASSGCVAAWAPVYGSLKGVPVTQATEALQPSIRDRADGKPEVLFDAGRVLTGEIFGGANEVAAPLTVVAAFGWNPWIANLAVFGVYNTVAYGSGLWAMSGLTSRVDFNTEGFFPASTRSTFQRGANSKLVVGASYGPTAHHTVSQVGAYGYTGTYADQNVGVLCMGSRSLVGSIDRSLGDGISSFWLIREALNPTTLLAARTKMAALYPELT